MAGDPLTATPHRLHAAALHGAAAGWPTSIDRRRTSVPRAAAVRAGMFVAAGVGKPHTHHTCGVAIARPRRLTVETSLEPR